MSNMALQHVLVFGDQTVEKLPSIQSLTKLSKSLPSLRRFLREATDVVQTEIMKVNLIERKPFGFFDNILALAEHNAAQDDPDEVVSTVIMCIERLGELILNVEKSPDILASRDSTLHILGFCTGLLPGAVAAFARDTSEIFKYGLEMISISFRLAIEFNRRSRRIEDSPQSWARTIVGTTATELQKILDEFNHKQGLPILKNVYLGVISRTWTTVFGPPSVLAQLWSYSANLALAPKLNIAAHAAVHAAHLPRLDLEKIVGTSPLLDTPMPSKACIISSSTCKPFVASNLRELLGLMIQDIAQNALHMEGTIQSVVSSVLGKGDVELIAVGPTPHTPLVQRALHGAGVTFTLAQNQKVFQNLENARGGSDLVAVVGMSGRFPKGNSISEFWETLKNGVDTHQQIPKSRFDVNTYFDPTGVAKNTATTQYGCFLENPGEFDSRLFNISPREAMQMDPLQRLFLMTSYEAMESAGYCGNSSFSTNNGRISTYFGQSGDDWRSINESQGIDIYYIPGGIRAFAPGRINYHFKWGGAYYSVDTACASSSTTVQLACSALIARECDTAVAGGGSLLTAPEMYAGLSRGGFLSTTGGCRTYNNNADGYCRGEGVGVVVLKRLEDAIADNDNIQAVIKGAARSYSADAVSITQPHGETQEKLFKNILRQTSVLPEEVGFVEMHGTATQAGDTVEMTSVVNVFGEKRSPNNPLVVGAVKASVGHGEAAAGITSLIKTILMLKENAIPPQPGMPFKTNHKFPALAKLNIHIADTLMEFKAYVKGDGKRKILLNNFDAAGGNTCLLVEDPPTQESKAKDPRPYNIVVCSARSTYSLRENKQRLLNHLNSYSEIRISDLAYTTTARRLHDVCRSAFVVRTTEDLCDRLAKDIESNHEAKAKAISGRPSVVFAFTGQGSQYAGMGKQLFHTSFRFKELILSYQELCTIQGLPSFVDLVADENQSIESKSTVQIQLAIVSLEIALANLWISWGVKPALVIGHSLGEYAALCVAGVLSISDTLYLVGTRALLLQENCTSGSHAMIAVALSSKSLAVILDGTYSSCQVSCLNSPNMTVVSGLAEEIRKLQGQLQLDSIRNNVLQVPYGFHSSQIDPILEAFGSKAKGCQFGKPLVPVISTLTASVVTDIGTFDSAYLVSQARHAVDYTGALQTCKSQELIDEHSVILEIGPQPICGELIRSNLDISSDRLLSTLKSAEENWKTISTTIAAAYLLNVTFNWPEFHKDYIKSLKLLELPSYAFDLKTYWTPYKRDGANCGPLLAAAVPAAPVSVFSTTCLHRVEDSSFEGDNASVTFASNTSEPKLYAAIHGHLVDGVALCPASVFYDMAFTAAKYIYNERYPKKLVPLMELSNLEMTHALVVSDIDQNQVIKTTASSSRPDVFVDVRFASIQGNSSHEHGHCRIIFGERNKRQSEWSRSANLVKKRVNALVKSSESGNSHRLMKPVVYKLFANLVAYDQKYQALEEVFVDNDFEDAMAKVKLKSGSGLGSFTYSPYWTDAIVHLSGFLLNGSYNKPDDIAYISTGLESLRIIGRLSEDKEYSCYATTQLSDNKGVSLGDVYLFEGSEIVAICAGIRFQKMTKAVFGIISGKDALTTSQKSGGQSKGLGVRHNLLSAKYTPQSRNHSLSRPILYLEGSEIPNPKDPDEYSEDSGTSSSTLPSSISQESGLDDVGLLLNLVASETGSDAAEMEDSTLFSDMGVDSLMSIAIISAFKKQRGIELPASFFNNFPSVKDVKEELGSPLSPAPAKSHPLEEKQAVSLVLEKASKPEPQMAKHSLNPSPVQERKPTFACNVVLMQGRPTNKMTPLFLITDGAGSSTAYIHLPPLPGGRRIYALESPYLQAPEEYTCTISDVCIMYVAALRKTQPHGPYLIGGWSAGGVYAYESARLLLSQGEKVLGLFIIDMRVPKSIPDALEPTMELVEQTGLITGIVRSGNLLDLISQKQKQHLLSTLKALVTFDPLPMAQGYQPDNTCIIWAALGLDETSAGTAGRSAAPASMGQVGTESGHGNNMEDPQTGLRSWFFAKRYTFGPNGWDKLVGEKGLECHKIEADHFSLVSPPMVKNLGEILKQAIEKFTA